MLCRYLILFRALPSHSVKLTLKLERQFLPSTIKILARDSNIWQVENIRALRSERIIECFRFSPQFHPVVYTQVSRFGPNSIHAVAKSHILRMPTQTVCGSGGGSLGRLL